jgi:VanZ family protein
MTGRPQGLLLARLAFWTAWLVSFTFAVRPLPFEIDVANSDKFLHILAFAVLSVLATLAFSKAPAWRVGLWLSAYGALIEIVQAIPILHRDSDIADWIVDTATVAIVLTVLKLMQSSVRQN